jgi:hypothetical protein
MDFIRDEIEEEILDRIERVEAERDFEEREDDREYEECREIERERYFDDEQRLRVDRVLERIRRAKHEDEYY